MIDKIDLFRLTADRMRYLTERQTVIARNVANADTPGYRAQDTAPFSFEGALLGTGGTSGAANGAGAAAPLALVRTAASHLASPQSGAITPTAQTSGTYGEKPDGNTVSIEEQMVKSADVANAFALATTAYSKAITLVKLAISGSK